MSLSSALVSKLSSVSAVTNLVGTRIYPQYQRIADKAYPAIVYKVEQYSTIQTYDATAANQLVSAQIVIACIGETYTQADAVATAVLSNLDSDAGTWGSTNVQGCFLQEDGVQDDVVLEQTATEEIIYHVKEISMLVWFVNS